MSGGNQDANILDMSDEEFLKQGGASAAPAPSTATTTDDDEEARRQKEQEDKDAEEAARLAAEQAAATAAAEGAKSQEELDAEEAARKEAEEATAKAAKEQEEADAAAKAAGTGDDPAKGAKPDDDKAVADDKGTKDSKGGEQDPAQKGNEDGKAAGPEGKAAAVDYQKEYERILAPFTANGRTIKVENAEEAIRLMQMGANYNKKMAGMKPHLAVLKLLENNGLLDQEKLSFLIDLDKKNPEAISKLVKDSGIDPLDISAEKAGGYKAGTHKVHPTEVELDQVLDEIKDSPKHAAVLDLVGNQWDGPSKQVIAAQPQLLKVINGHMENGIYDLIAPELERQRLFGGLNGLSDLEAYRQVGDAMAKDGKFDHILKPAGQPGQGGTQTPVAKAVVQPKPKSAEDSKREEQRRAAAPAKAAAPAGKAKSDFDPLALSDEEFLKINSKR